jgi:hypothetical protein
MLSSPGSLPDRSDRHSVRSLACQSKWCHGETRAVRSSRGTRSRPCRRAADRPPLTPPIGGHKLGLRFYQQVATAGGPAREHLLMAAAFAATLPIVVIFFLFQRQFVRGIVLSGIKG